jgi:hypothetical protein
MFSFELRRNGDHWTEIISCAKDCTETSVKNYHYTMHNITNDHISEGDTITTLIITFCSYSETFSFEKGTRQAPSIFKTSVCPLSTVHCPLSTFHCPLSTLHSTPLTDLHAIRSHTFESHLYAVSFIPHQSAITI